MLLSNIDILAWCVCVCVCVCVCSATMILQLHCDLYNYYTDVSKMHKNRTILFFIETVKYQ